MHIQSLRAKHDKNSVIEANGLIFRSQRYFIGGAVVVGENMSYNLERLKRFICMMVFHLFFVKFLA